MNILITGAAGFVGRNLTEALKCIRDGKDKTHPGLEIGELYLYDIDSTPEELEIACKNADFVINMAGVNRPQTPEEFMQGNFGFASVLLDTLKTWVSTGITSFCHKTAPTTLAVLRPTPGRRTNSSKVEGTSPPKSRTSI